MDTIKSSSDISQLFSSGFRIHTPYLTFIVGACSRNKANGNEQHDRLGRVAFVAGKKQGNAVWRNSAKRRMRSLCRDLGGPWPGFDVVFLAKKALLQESYADVVDAGRRALRRSDALSEEK